MIGLRATAQTPTLDAWRRKLRGGVAQRIATAAARGQQLRVTQEAPVDTGALSISAVVVTPQDDDSSVRASAVRELRPAATLLPAPPRPPADSATVACIVDYAALVNDGTIHQAAQPFWDRARVQTAADLPRVAAEQWRT